MIRSHSGRSPLLTASTIAMLTGASAAIACSNAFAATAADEFSCRPPELFTAPMSSRFWLDPIEAARRISDADLRVLSPGGAGSSPMCADPFQAICSAQERVPAPVSTEMRSSLVTAWENGGPSAETRLAGAESAALSRGRIPWSKLDEAFSKSKESLGAFIAEMSELPEESRTKLSAQLRETAMLTPSQLLRHARALAAGQADFAGFENHALAEIERSCGRGGWVSNAFYEPYSKRVVLCPGFVLTLSGFESPASAEAFLWNVLAHEIGHGLIPLNPPPLPGIAQCLIETAPDSVPRSSLDPANLDEIKADYLAGEALGKALRGKSVPEVEAALRLIWSHRCDSQGGPEHPPGYYRIGWGVGRSPAVRAALHCPPLTAEQPGCDRLGRVPR